MFLFTTPTTPSQPPPGSPTASPVPSTPVTDAIRRGAAATGTDFDYLLRTAKRESALDPGAKAPTSSATGLFQFIEQTWLGVVKHDGPALGLPNEAGSIVARQDGTYAVPDAAAREAILKLRERPDIASAMAGALTRRNRDALNAATGRAPSNGELYLAHVLGARGASQLIATAQSNPERPAATDFPEAARANRSIFYKAGRPRSVAEVYAVLTADRPGAAAPVQGGDVKLAVTDQRPPGIYGLFQTGARQSPVSDAVARIWRAQGSAARADSTPGSRFFPRSTPREEVASAEEVAPAATNASLPAEAPLPPPRPAFASDQLALRTIAPLVQFRSPSRVMRP